jgi:hypothetical protein
VLGALKEGVARSSVTLLLSALCQKVLPDTPQAGTALNLSSVKKLLLVCIRGDVQIATAETAVDLGSCLAGERRPSHFLWPIADVLQLILLLFESYRSL